MASVLLEDRRFRGDVRQRFADRTYLALQAWQIAGLAGGLVCARLLPRADPPGSEWLRVALGCALGLAGLVLRWWAIRTLGARFTRDLRVAADHALVDEGPYRRVRHPSYTGAILVFTGIGVGLGNALSILFCALLPAWGYVRRIPREEALLRRTLGEPYAEYADRTDRLIPGLW